MIKKTVTYVNPFTEQQVSEELYFHISKADMVEMEVEEHNAKYVKDGEELTGMRAHLQRIVDSEDGKAVLKEFKAILRRAYGKKVGDRFVKNPEIWAEFEGSEAYSELLFELLTNAEEAGRFFSSMMPGNLEQIAAEVAARAEAEEKTAPAQVQTAPAPVQGSTPDTNDWLVKRKPVIDAATSESPVVVTEADIQAMDTDVFRSGLADGRFKLS